MFSRLAEAVYTTINRLTPCDVTHVLLLDLQASQIMDPDPGLEIRKLTAAEVVALAKNSEHNQVTEVIASDLETRQIDFYAAYRQAGVNGHELAGYLLAGQGEIPAHHNSGGTPLYGIGMSLPRGVSYIFKCFVLPDMRGKGVLTHLLEAVKSELREQGISHLITTTDWTNKAALRSFERTGFERCGIAGEWVPLPVIKAGGPHLFRLPSTKYLSNGRQIGFNRGMKNRN